MKNKFIGNTEKNKKIREIITHKFWRRTFQESGECQACLRRAGKPVWQKQNKEERKE